MEPVKIATSEELRAMRENEYRRQENEHWQDVRERAAIAAMQAIISNPNSKITSKSLGIIPQNAVCFADFLVDELKMQLETTKTNSLSGDAWLEEKYVMCRDKGTEKQGSQIPADSAKTCKDEYKQALIDKACKWLSDNMYEGTCEQILSKKTYPFMRLFVEDFKQAMKDEQFT